MATLAFVSEDKRPMELIVYPVSDDPDRVSHLLYIRLEEMADDGILVAVVEPDVADEMAELLRAESRKVR